MIYYVYIYIYLYKCRLSTFRCQEKEADRLNLWEQVAGREGVQRELAHRENNRFRRMSSTSIAPRKDADGS